MCGSVWRSMAVFVRVSHYNTLTYRSLLCKMIFINGFMQKTFDISGRNGSGIERFSLLYPIRPAGRIFVFTGTRQVVF